MKHVTIIAEAGVNHNGDFKLAKRLIEQAAIAGADYIKFQTFKAENLVTKIANKASYQIKNINDGDYSQFEMLKNLEMPYEWHFNLFEYANELGIKFLSTGFDEESIDFLNELGVDIFKIPSGEITNKPYLEHIARKGKPIIMSTGMANMDEINDAIQVLDESGIKKENIIILHCNTEYPTPMCDVNLLAMNYIKNSLGVEVGYSDHTLGIEVPIAAVALGASVIEKHFTLNRDLPGPDHAASLEPSELKAMVSAIRNVELALGSEIKSISQSERKNKIAARKSIVASKKIVKGELFTIENLTTKRPGNGINPMLWYDVIGKVSPMNFNEDDLIILY